MFHSKDNLTLFAFNSADNHSGLLMAMSTRSGGVSQGIYRSLNLSFGVDDDTEAVLTNRKIFCQSLSIALDSIVVGQQVHGAGVVLVSERDRGKGALSWADALPETDAMVTNHPDLALMVLAADCPPVFLHDPAKKAIGIAHGSWRGTLGGIVRKTVDKMGAAFGSRPEDMQAGIGPSIGPCCYEVGEDVLAALRKSSPDSWEDCIVPQANGAIHFNLWESIRRQLVDSGLEGQRIETADICTACHTDLFFSHRGEGGRTGRNGAVIALRGDKRETFPP